MSLTAPPLFLSYLPCRPVSCLYYSLELSLLVSDCPQGCGSFPAPAEIGIDIAAAACILDWVRIMTKEARERERERITLLVLLLCIFILSFSVFLPLCLFFELFIFLFVSHCFPIVSLLYFRFPTFSLPSCNPSQTYICLSFDLSVPIFVSQCFLLFFLLQFLFPLFSL